MSRNAGDKLEIAHYAGTWENLPSAYWPAGFRVFTIALLLCTALTAGTIESKGGLSLFRDWHVLIQFLVKMPLYKPVPRPWEDESCLCSHGA